MRPDKILVLTKFWSWRFEKITDVLYVSRVKRLRDPFLGQHVTFIPRPFHLIINHFNCGSLGQALDSEGLNMRHSQHINTIHINYDGIRSKDEDMASSGVDSP